MSHSHSHNGAEEHQRPRTYFDRLPAVASGLIGTVFSAAFVAVYWEKHPDFKPAAALLFFLCASIIISYG